MHKGLSRIGGTKNQFHETEEGGREVRREVLGRFFAVELCCICHAFAYGMLSVLHMSCFRSIKTPVFVRHSSACKLFSSVRRGLARDRRRCAAGAAGRLTLLHLQVDLYLVYKGAYKKRVKQGCRVGAAE
jgi:hypothetical protein